MADFGSNFTDAFTAVYGGGLRARQQGIENARQAKMDAITQATFEHQKQDWADAAKQKSILASAGTTPNANFDPTTGVNDTYMSALKGERAPSALPVSMADMQSTLKNGFDPKGTTTSGAIPSLNFAPIPAGTFEDPAAKGNFAPAPVAAMPAPGLQANTPAATPPAPAKMKAPAELAPMVIGHPDTNGDHPVIDPSTPVVSNADKNKIPDIDNYVETMLNGKHVWVPKDKVTRLQGGDLVMAQAQALSQSGLNPQLAADMFQKAQMIQKGNIELTTERYKQGMTQALATGDLNTIQNAFDQLGTGVTKHEISQDGNVITSKAYISNPDGTKHYVGEPHVFKGNPLHSAFDRMKAELLSYSSAEAMTAHLTQEAQDITNIGSLVAQQARTANDAAELKLRQGLQPYQIAALQAQTGASNSTTAANEAATEALRTGIPKEATQAEASANTAAQTAAAKAVSDGTIKPEEAATYAGQQMAAFYNGTQYGRMIAARMAGSQAGGGTPSAGGIPTPNKPAASAKTGLPKVKDDTWGGDVSRKVEGVTSAIARSDAKQNAAQKARYTEQWKNEVNPLIQAYRKQAASGTVSRTDLVKLRDKIKNFPASIVSQYTTPEDRAFFASN